MNETVLYVGERGTGKSLRASRYCSRALDDDDAIVVSNLAFNAPRARKDGRLLYYSDMYDLIKVVDPLLEVHDDIIIFMDEMNNLVSSRSWKDTSEYFMWLLGQDRHFGVSIIGTTRHIMKIEVDFRRQLDCVVECRTYPWPLTRNLSRKAQKKGKNPSSLFSCTQYEGIAFGQWSETVDPEKLNKPKPTYGAHFWQGWYTIRKEDREFFNTFERLPAPFIICKTCGHIIKENCDSCGTKGVNKRPEAQQPLPVAPGYNV